MEEHGLTRTIDVVHDVLDKHIVDRNGREMGRVDGISVELRGGAPPRLAKCLNRHRTK